MTARTRLTALRPLRRRDFALLWTALAISLIGDGIWLVAIPWHLVSTGAGPQALALVTGAGSVGVLVSLFAGGLLADLRPRRTVLVAGAFTAAVIMAVLAGLGALDRLGPVPLAVASFLLSGLQGASGPSIETLIPTLVPDTELQAAYGLEEMLESIALRAAGPALGGLVVALAGPVGALAIDAVSFLLAVVLLLFIRGGRTPAVPEAATGWLSARSHLLEAARYIGRHRWLWTGIGWAGLALLAQIGPRQVLLPFVVAGPLSGGPADLGLLLAAFGIGATAGALLAASRPTPDRYLTVMFTAWAAGSLPLVVLPFAGHLPVAAVALGAAGFFSSIGNVLWSTVTQRRVPAGLRGRVSSFDWFGTLALIPVSVTVAGALGSSTTGTRVAFAVAGLGPALLAVVAVVGAGLRADEKAHPIAGSADPITGPGDPITGPGPVVPPPGRAEQRERS